MLSRTVALTALAIFISGVPAGAQGPAAGSPAAAISARQQGMKAIGAANKGLADSIARKGEAADLRRFATRLNELAIQSGGWFPKGSGPEAGFKTKASDAIWTKPVEFKMQNDALVKETAKLVLLSKSNNLDAVKAQFAVVRKRCKVCHDGFTTD